MSLSKIYQRGAFGEVSSLQFTDFGLERDGGGMVTGRAESAGAPQPAGAFEAGVESAGHRGEDAFARGRQEGLAEAEGKLSRTAGALASALEDISRLRETILKNSTDDMLRLVMAVAEQVVHAELGSRPELILETLKRALAAAVRSDEYRVRLHPEDLALVTEKKPLLLASLSGLKNLVLEASPQVTRGGCLVESELGEVDATLEGQLAEIRQRLQSAAQGG